MDSRVEMAAIVRDALLELIRPVQILTLNPEKATGAVSGRFRSGKMIFDYDINPDQEQILYKPLRDGGEKARSDGLQDRHRLLPGTGIQLGPKIPDDMARLDAMTEALHGGDATSWAYLQALTGWSADRLDAMHASEARMDAGKGGARTAQGKNCGVGYGCGSSCISRSKDCKVKASSVSLKRLSGLVAGSGTSQTALGRNLRGPSDRVSSLMQRRDALIAGGLEMLSKPRDGTGATLMEHPTPRALRALVALDRRVREVDQELNQIEGRNPARRRWEDGTPGLAEFSGHMAPPHANTPGRVAYRKELIDAALAEGSTVGKGSGGRPLAVVMMGGPGSGKSTMLNKVMADKTGFVSVDPDAVKEVLPEYLMGVANSDRRAAARAHEESSTMVADEIKKRAIDGGYNVILDGTGKNGPKYEKMILDLKQRGYEVQLMMPHLPLEEGVSRVEKRADRNGRFVPTAVVEDAYRSIPGNFERLARIADSAVLKDGLSKGPDGRLTMEPIMEYSGGRMISSDAAKASAFRRKYGRSS